MVHCSQDDDPIANHHKVFNIIPFDEKKSYTSLKLQLLLLDAIATPHLNSSSTFPWKSGTPPPWGTSCPSG